MLSQHIKESTKSAHQALEGTVVRQMKAIRSEADYADFLNNFYIYFNAIEKAILPYISKDVLHDYADRRKSDYIKADIESLGGTVENRSDIKVPEINNPLEALSALYVLEGSIMGGPIIVQMLNKYGIHKGTSFFSGYGEDTGKMWGIFTAALNAQGENPDTHPKAADIANETFSRFGDVFNTTQVS